MPILHMETELVRSTGCQLQQTASLLQQESQQLAASVQTLVNVWQGNSSTIFVGEMQPLLQQLSQFADAGKLLSQRLQREITEWEDVGRHLGSAATGFDGFLNGDTNWLDDVGIAGVMAGGSSAAGIWANITFGNTTGVKGHTEDFLIHGVKIEMASRYRAGEMSFEDVVKNWAEMEKSLKPDYVETDWTLYQISKGEAEVGMAAWKDSFSSKYGNMDVAVGSVEAKGSHNIKLGKDGMTAEIQGQMGAYLVHAEYDTEVAGVDVAAEGYFGAQAEGEAELKFNPIAGMAVASVGMSGFFGGRIDASANKEFDVAGVKADLGARGSVSYGVGGKFDAEVGIDKGVFKADVDIGATIGLGGEIGFTVEFDVQDAATNVVDVGRDALDWLF